MIGKHLKEYKKSLKGEGKPLNRKHGYKKNNNWRKQWLPYIKYDHNFDGNFLIQLIVYKLHIMLDFYEHGKYCLQCDEERLAIVDELREACRLGDLILEDKFEEEAYKIMGEHMKVVTTPNENGTVNWGHVWDSKENEDEYKRLTKIGEEEREKTIDEFFKYIRAHYMNWWD